MRGRPGALPQKVMMECYYDMLGRALFMSYVAVVELADDVINTEFAPTPNVSKLVGDIPKGYLPRPFLIKP
jgi:hypothetical protein